MSVTVTINGVAKDIEPGLKLQDLLQQLELGSGPVAVEVNGEIVPRSEHPRHQLQAMDKIEIVQAIGGG